MTNGLLLARSASECIPLCIGRQAPSSSCTDKPILLLALRANLIACLMLLCLGCQENKPAPVKSAAAKQEPASIDNREAKPDKAASPVESSDKSAEHLQKQGWESLRRGLDWLLAQQAKDGGWHSQTYGPFKGGAATTALVLYAARRLPIDVRCQHAEAWKRAWKFLEPGVQKKGFVVCPDGTMDEPVYATALVLLARRPLLLNIKEELLISMENFLINERCGKERGFKPDDPNYGGWDLAGGTGLGADTLGSNVSITRFATLAVSQELQYLGLTNEIATWTTRVQNLPGDGGFFFHPQSDHEGNKAQWADGDSREKPRSYGTATCDGLMLLAWAKDAFEEGEEKLVQSAEQAAQQWLIDHPAVDRVPGFEDAPPETGWQQGLLFYYLMSLAQASQFLPEDVRIERRQAILQQLLSMQKEDGRWQNESARMREDDPLIATSFAIVALGELMKYESQDSNKKP
jgi:hypothetical protein